MGQVKLNVYSVDGKLVKNLLTAFQLPGYYEVSWDGQDNHHRRLKPGLYFLELATENYLLSKEIVIK